MGAGGGDQNYGEAVVKEPGVSVTVLPLHGPLLRTETFVVVLACPCPVGHVDWGGPDGRWLGVLGQGCRHSAPKSVPLGHILHSRSNTGHHSDESPECLEQGKWSRERRGGSSDLVRVLTGK